MKEQDVLVVGYSGYDIGFGTSSLTYMAQMTKGEHVWFASEPHGSDISHIRGGHHSNYGGALIYV